MSHNQLKRINGNCDTHSLEWKHGRRQTNRIKRRSISSICVDKAENMATIFFTRLRFGSTWNQIRWDKNGWNEFRKIEMQTPTHLCTFAECYVKITRPCLQIWKWFAKFRVAANTMALLVNIPQRVAIAWLLQIEAVNPVAIAHSKWFASHLAN